MEEGWKEGKEREKEKRRKEGGSKRKALRRWSYWSWLGSGEGHGRWVFIKEATVIQTLLGEKPNF